jgi:site-specific DNA-methyltransferase (adenine-specific)
VASEPTTHAPGRRWRLIGGDALEILRSLPTGGFDGLLCDPPYGLADPRQPWDASPPSAEVWREAARVLRPGSWLLAFGGTRTHHRLMLAVEQAGLELRDTLAWLYGTGFPKGPATLKPAWEPVVLARRPGPLHPLAVDACRTQGEVLASDRRTSPRGRKTAWGAPGRRRAGERHHPGGRWPANVLLGHGPGCRQAGCEPSCPAAVLEAHKPRASRFFYCPKPAGREAAGNPHPTRKPVALCRWLARLILPPEPPGPRRLLVPYCGSGSEMLGALAAGWAEVVGIDSDPRWLQVARRRLVSYLESRNRNPEELQGAAGSSA